MLRTGLWGAMLVADNEKRCSEKGLRVEETNSSFIELSGAEENCVFVLVEIV